MLDLIIHRYLPAGVIKTEAEYLAIRGAFQGKIEANLALINGSTHVEAMVDLVPTSFGRVPSRLLTTVERATLEFAKAHAANHIEGVTDGVRDAMKSIIIEHVQASVLGQKEGTAKALCQRLFDCFGDLNLDFYAIAVTEMGECTNQGFIAAQSPGATVRRMEAYQGACMFCESINGKLFEVVRSNASHKDGLTQVWVGKTNVGRSPSRRKANDEMISDRLDCDAWWPAAGLQHSCCRGSWLLVSAKPPAVSQEFEVWLQALVRKT